MRGAELHGLDAAIGLVAIALIVFSFAARAYMFLKLRGEASIRDLLEEASPIGSDWLAIRLIRRFRTLSIEARFPVLLFVVTNLGGLILMVVLIFYVFMIGD